MWKTERPPRKGNYLAGSFIKLPEVDGYLPSVNPGNTRDILGRYAYSLSAVDFAVETAASVQTRWHRTAIGNRKLLLERFADALVGFRDAFVASIVREIGKPEWEADLELKAAVKYIELVLADTAAGLDPHHAPELDAMTEQHPWGVTAVLGSYDRPLLSPVTQLVPALLAGNCVILKPSRYAPVVGQLIAESIDRAKFPRGVFSMVQGRGRQVGERLVTHPDVDVVLVQGSTNTARRLRRSLADQPWKQLVLGSCARGTAIVLDDAEVDKAAYELVLGAFLTTGQRRSSTCRVLVTQHVADSLIQKLVAVTNRLGIGQGFEPGVFLGPLVAKAVRRRFLEFLQGAINLGMDLLTPSYPVEYAMPGYYVHPALLYGPTSLLEREQTSEDVLGPVLEIFVAKDFDEAVTLHNRSRTTSVTALFTRTVDYLHEARYRLRSETIHFNCSTVHLSARLPLPGQDHSVRPVGLAGVLRRSSRTLALYQDRKPFDPQHLVPGIHWPEPPAPAEAEDHADAEVDDEVTLIIDPNATPEVPHPPTASQTVSLATVATAHPPGGLDDEDDDEEDDAETVLAKLAPTPAAPTDPPERIDG